MESVDAVCCCPGLVAMSVQFMDGNDTGMKSEQALTTIRNSLLYDRLNSFGHNLENLEGYFNRLPRLRRFTSLLSLSAPEKVARVGFWMSRES